MNPTKNFKPTHDRYDRDRDGAPSGVNQVNPQNTENQGGDPAPTLEQQGGDPAEPRPRQAHVNRARRGGDEPDLD